MSETLKRRPWWAAALVGGGAAGAAIVAALGTGGAHGESPARVTTSGIYAMHDEVTAEQLRSLTTTISNLQTRLDTTIAQVSELNGRLSRIEGRLESR